MLKIINLTPHEIHMYDPKGKELLEIIDSDIEGKGWSKPTPKVIIDSEKSVVGNINGYDLINKRIKEVKYLPQKVADTVYIVYRNVAESNPHRDDLIFVDNYSIQPDNSVKCSRFGTVYKKEEE